MTTNTQIRSEIMEILDDNSKNIPEGVYLELCNKLQKFKFYDCKDVIGETRLNIYHTIFSISHFLVSSFLLYKIMQL